MQPPKQGMDPEARSFYQGTIDLLHAHNVPFLVGGAYAFNRYTGIERHTKDFDVFVRKADCARALQVLNSAGYVTEMTDEVWIAKAFHQEHYVDLIFGSANGVANVDEGWFEFSVPSEVLSKPVLLVPPEEMIWQKAFIMERDRFDGADVAHLIQSCADKINWDRLLERFDEFWSVLFVHLIMFNFIYPSKRDLIPLAVVEKLVRRFVNENQKDISEELICNGTIFSATQYLPDLISWGFADGRPEHAQRPAA